VSLDPSARQGRAGGTLRITRGGAGAPQGGRQRAGGHPGGADARAGGVPGAPYAPSRRGQARRRGTRKPETRTSVPLQ